MENHIKMDDLDTPMYSSPQEIGSPPYLCRSFDPLSPRLKTPASQLEQLRELPNNHRAPAKQRRSPRESPQFTAVFQARSPLKRGSTQSIPTMCLWGWLLRMPLVPIHLFFASMGRKVYLSTWMVEFYGINVGKCTSPMDTMGKAQQRSKWGTWIPLAL